MDPKTLDRSAARQRLLDNLERFRGAEALFREGMGISLVRVDEIEPGDKGISARIALLPTRGLYNERPASWGVYSAWDVFGCSEDRWDAAYISMTVYFERGLIDWVVRWCASAPDEPYNQKRFNQIGRCIKEYRKSQLAPLLTPELQLFRNGRLIGTAADLSLEHYPEVRGKFVPADLDAELKDALSAFARWFSTPAEEEPADAEDLAGGWWLETTEGLRLETVTPLIDFTAATIELRFLGTTAR